MEQNLNLVVAGACMLLGVPAFLIIRDLGATLMALAVLNYALYRSEYIISVI